MSEQTSEPAFPLSAGKDWTERGYRGMTLRDYFAAKALALLLPYFSDECKEDDGIRAESEACAHRAYLVADAMLAERAK